MTEYRVSMRDIRTILNYISLFKYNYVIFITMKWIGVQWMGKVLNNIGMEYMGCMDN